MIFSKEVLLARKSPYEILNHYLAPYHSKGDLKSGTLISNPFLLQKQKTPSFNIFLRGKDWRYHDFATGDHGDCFKLVMELFGLSFREVLEKIGQDLNMM